MPSVLMDSGMLRWIINHHVRGLILTPACPTATAPCLTILETGQRSAASLRKSRTQDTSCFLSLEVLQQWEQSATSSPSPPSSTSTASLRGSRGSSAKSFQWLKIRCFSSFLISASVISSTVSLVSPPIGSSTIMATSHFLRGCASTLDSSEN